MFLSQGAGHVPLYDPADKGEEQASVWHCEGANLDHNTLFGHRGGAADWSVWRTVQRL